MKTYLNKKIEHVFENGKILFTDGTSIHSEKIHNLQVKFEERRKSLLAKIDATIEEAKESKNFDWNKILQK